MVVNSVEATRTITTITDTLMEAILSKDSTETSTTITTTTTKVVIEQVEATTIKEVTIVTATPIVVRTAIIVISLEETDHSNSNNNHYRTTKPTMENSTDKMVPRDKGSSMPKKKPIIDHLCLKATT